MSTGLFVICGRPGTGKTTLVRKLEPEVASWTIHSEINTNVRDFPMKMTFNHKTDNINDCLESLCMYTGDQRHVVVFDDYGPEHKMYSDVLHRLIPICRHVNVALYLIIQHKNDLPGEFYRNVEKIYVTDSEREGQKITFPHTECIEYVQPRPSGPNE